MKKATSKTSKSTKSATKATKATKPDPKAAAAKPEPKAAAAKPEPKAAKKEPIERDAFGSKLGSKAAKINSVLTRKPQTMAEIVEKAQLEETAYDYLNRKAAAGLIVKADNADGVATFALPARK
jgi:hypothetical protein